MGLAEDAYRRALALAPDVATYHAGLGVVLARQGQLEEGVEELERAVDLDATYGMAFAQLADLYLESIKLRSLDYQLHLFVMQKILSLLTMQ